MRPREIFLTENEFKADAWIISALPLMRQAINDEQWGLTPAIAERFGENAELAVAIGMLRNAPELSELVEALVIERLDAGDVHLEKSLSKLLESNK